MLPELDEIIAGALEQLSDAGNRIPRPSPHAAYGFRHALIQETVYNSTLRKPRQAFHRRLYSGREPTGTSLAG